METVGSILVLLAMVTVLGGFAWLFRSEFYDAIQDYRRGKQ